MAREPKFKYKNQTDRDSAVEELQNLKNQPGWKRIVKYYDEKIAWIQSVINGETKNDDGKDIITSKEDLDLWRSKKNMAEQFRNLPDILVEVSDALQGEDINLDPFDDVDKR